MEPGTDGGHGHRLLAIPSRPRLERVLRYLLDEIEFFSPFGIRSLSRYHQDHPYVARLGGQEQRVSYEPGESTTAMFGGNSNWRGPVWFPVNYIVIRSLLQYDRFFGPAFTVEYPTGSGKRLTLREVAGDLAERLIGIWLPDHDGRRPVYGGMERFQTDPDWRDNLFFHEYFHGDNGAGLGASHQTGWTAVVADLILDDPGQASRLIADGVAAPTAR